MPDDNASPVIPGVTIPASATTGTLHQTSGGVPENYTSTGGDNFISGSPGWEAAKRKNDDKKDLRRAAKAFEALEDDDEEEFERISKSLENGFIVGRGARP